MTSELIKKSTLKEGGEESDDGMYKDGEVGMAWVCGVRVASEGRAMKMDDYRGDI